MNLGQKLSSVIPNRFGSKLTSGANILGNKAIRKHHGSISSDMPDKPKSSGLEKTHQDRLCKTHHMH